MRWGKVLVNREAERRKDVVLGLRYRAVAAKARFTSVMLKMSTIIKARHGWSRPA
jgi:hypothetical protein